MVRVLTDRRVLLSTAVIGVLLSVALWPRTITVDVVRVSRGPLVVTVDGEGHTRVRDRFVVAAPVSGRVLRIEIEPGDRVFRGAVVARVQPTTPPLLNPRAHAEAVAALESAEASLGQAGVQAEHARWNLAHAQRQLARSRELNASGAAATADLDTLETNARHAAETANAAAFAVHRAAAIRARAQARLATFATTDANRTVSVESPVDGVVLTRHRQSEGIVFAGEPLLDIGDPGQLEIVTDLLSSDAVRVNAGTDATIDLWGGEPFAATVQRVEPAGFAKVSALGTEEQRVNVILDLADTGEEPVPVGDAYHVEVRITEWEAPDVVKVPTSALVRHGAKWAVYVATGRRARRVIVTIGRHTGLEAEVTSGLAEGTVVVVYPSDLVHDGVRIADRARQ